MKKDLRLLLADKLEPWELKLVYKSYDIVGDIAVIRVPEPLKQRSEIIAEAVMKSHKQVKAVWRQTSSVSGDFRLRDLDFLLGEKKTETLHKEHGCIFKVDLEKCYFSPRLAYERMRLAQQVQPGDVILNMFAGVGCYSVIIAKYSDPKEIFSIDINPVAIQYMQENIKLNGVEAKVVLVRGDAKKVIQERLENVADRVLMPLPEKAYEYLDYALLALKPTGGWIHYYDFEHANKGESPVEKIQLNVSKKLQRLGGDFQVVFGRIARSTGPNWYQVVLDIQVKKSS
jgi:tRNA (guanine37-N1)-methyltransferase